MGEIKSEKILLKDIFSRMWFRIPAYQRPYVWTTDQVRDLLDDLTFAQEQEREEYFLGSFVFQSRTADQSKGEKFDENDLLDGQQRMSTLLMLFAVIRDIAADEDARSDCQECIHQEARKYKKVPERVRLEFPIRVEVQKFIEKYVKTKDGTKQEDELTEIATSGDDVSLKNMAQAILEIHKFFAEEEESVRPEELLDFLLNRVLLIYVSTEDREDAFRLFMILNNRGIPLRNSDILKSMNIGALNTEEEKVRYAEMWEEAENELGDEFNRFLSYIRTILVKDKARLSLLQEFEEKIYTGSPPLLTRGEETFRLLERYLEHHRTVLDGNNYDQFESFEFDNLVKVMLEGLPVRDWVPPLLHYFERFRFDQALKFLQKLDNKFSADWILKDTPTERIKRMNRIIETIDGAATAQQVLEAKCFESPDAQGFRDAISGRVYDKRYCRYLLLKLDYLYQDHSHRMNFERLSVEHVLPQNPSDKSQWVADFTPEQQDTWTDCLGNLVLISRRKNSSLGRLDYAQKKKRYFERNISTCPNSLRVIKNDRWTLAELEANHKEVLGRLEAHYKI